MGPIALLWVGVAAGQGFPNDNYTADQLWELISPDMGAIHFNQPIAVDGYVLMGGNAVHEIWDISDPFAPVHVSTLTSPHHDGEAESHQLSVRVEPDGTVLAATISGRGVDLWDITVASAPVLLSALELEGIQYGDNTAAVWGMSWQGDALYVGGTNTGLHIVDTTNPNAPVVVDRIPTTEFGGVSAGPLYAVGNLLVITPPKDHRGIATLDIGDPWDPYLLDFEIPDQDTYIGGFYGGWATHLDPLRIWDVTTDPTDIQLIAQHDTFDSEYVSFGDGYAFIGALRPNPGVHKIDLSDPTVFDEVGKVDGRYDLYDGVLTDDQFSVPIGNLLVVCDDEIRYGCVLGVHDTSPDFLPPEVAWVEPSDGAVNQPITTRIGLSMTDQIDTRTVGGDAIELRPLTGGSAVSGRWGVTQTVVSFWPDRPLSPDTSYEVIVRTNGMTDLAGNGLASEFRSVFSTGPDVASLSCDLAGLAPVQVGASASLAPAEPGGATSFDWDFGDGAAGSGSPASHIWSAPGRYPVTLTVSDGINERTCAGVQIVHRPLLDATPTHASSVLADPARGRIWKVNPDNDSVAAIDADALQVVHEVQVGDHPRTLAQTDDGRIWVTCQDSDEVVVLDPDSAAILDRVELHWGGAPYGVSADGNAVWVTLEQRGEAVRIAKGRVERTVKLGKNRPPVRGLAVSDGVAWVSRFVSAPDGAEVYRVDGQGSSTLSLRVDPGPDSNDGGRGVPNYLVSLTVSPDGARLLVPSKKDNVGRGGFRDGQPLDADNTVRTVLSFVDLSGDAEATAERLDLDDRERLTAGVYSPAGDLIFAVSQGSNQVDVIDAYSGLRVAGFGTGLAPDGLALLDGRLYVGNFLDRSVSVFDVQGILAGTDGAAWLLDEVPTVAAEALEPEVLLGKQIFYNANSREMSADGYLSCASCHLDGGHDGQTWDFTDRGEGLRNTIDLRGKAGTAHGPLHWSANFDEIQDFENDIRHAFGGSGLMDDADFDETNDPLGLEKAGRSERLDALAAYVESLDSFPRSPWRTAKGEMTDEALKGRKLVERKCLECHGGKGLTDSRGTAGMHDVGTIRKSSGGRLGGPLKGIDTPTLLGLHATAPYLHDGSAKTLHDVLEDRDHVGRLSQKKKDRIVAFLLQLEPRDLPLEPRGCGCNSSGGTWVLAWIPVLLGLRRRDPWR